ncbi:shikimate dehydrogenase [Marinitoga sp. 1154]|uniref:shikimate dehydrogenase family protein n=1 Tax=Marinitoga sp. 1154 TaxID=1643335 RepID=UPI001586E090|nr:shikimate dehydrogenase [Marinitoga sp. 1154]
MIELKFGIVQYPEKISLSEKIYNKYFKYMDIHAVYEGINIKPEDFDKKINTIISNYYGLNITIPYKEKIFKYINPSDDAIFLGAVNTIYNNRGYNTDWVGFFNSIKNEDLNGNILVLGAGGASKAVLYGLYKLGIDRLVLINRTYEKAIKLKKLFDKKINIRVKPFDKLNDEIYKTSIFINTTSIGMFGESIPIDLNKNLKLVYDVIYIHTPLQKVFEKAQIKVINGEKMWYYQAIENLKIWGLYNKEIFDLVFNF